MYRDWILCTIKIREGIDEWAMNRFTNLIKCTWIRYMITWITIKRERNEPAGEWSERGFQKISLTTHRTARTNEHSWVNRN